jgi:hypothetical protein
LSLFCPASKLVEGDPPLDPKTTSCHPLSTNAKEAATHQFHHLFHCSPSSEIQMARLEFPRNPPDLFDTHFFSEMTQNELGGPQCLR